MPLTKLPQEILIVEDNPGDYLLVAESIREEFIQPLLHHAATFSQANAFLQQNQKFNVILLDLSLPDAQGETLVRNMVQLAGLTPIIVLTGYSDKDFGVKTLQLGVSDYLLKDELNGSQLYKSITYSIERKRIHTELNESQEKYRRLFQLSPLPMWVFNTDTLMFMDVNDAAVRHYGYTRAEFLTMMIQEIRPASDAGYVTEEVWDHMRSGEYFNDHVIHQKKSGEHISVVIESNSINLDGQRARLVLATDVTEKLKAEEALKQSERRFKALVQDSADIIAIINKEGDYLYVSPTSYSVLGLEPESFIGKNAFNFIHPDDAMRIQNNLSELPARKRVKTEPFRINILGKDFWMETILTDMTNDPAVEGIVVNASDVTQRIEYEKQISEGLERYNTVSKATSDVIYDWDFAEDTVIWNRGVEGIFGYSDVSVTTNSWWYERVHPEEAGQMVANVQSHIAENKLRWQGEYRFRCADGSFKYVLDRSFLVYDTSGKPVRMIGAMQDITDRTAYIQAIEKQNRKLREIAWLQSHVVRAPLSRIMGLIDLIKDDPADKQTPEMLDHILTSAFELDEVVRSIVNRAAEAEDYSKQDGDEHTAI